MKYLIFILVMGLLVTLLGCGSNSEKDNAEPVSSPITKAVENISATADQKERRIRSEKICTSKGIPIYKNPNSLFTDSENTVKIRTKDEVVDRALALLYLGLKSEGLEQVHLDRVDKTFDISSKFSPKEKIFVRSSQPTQQQMTDANWRYESLHVLLWSLGYIDELIYPDVLCNVGDDVKIIYELGPEKFRTQAKLRDKAEILDEADLILRYHWAIVSARIKNASAPAGLNSSVIYERHYSLNWLIQYMKQDWDEVSTNT